MPLSPPRLPTPRAPPADAARRRALRRRRRGFQRAIGVDPTLDLQLERLHVGVQRDEVEAAAGKLKPGDKNAVAAEKAATEAETAVDVALSTVERMKATARGTADKLAAAQKDLAAREELRACRSELPGADEDDRTWWAGMLAEANGTT